MSSTPLLDPNVESQTNTARFRTIIFNNDTTPMDAVMLVLMRATSCDADEAYMEMWEAHTFGQADVHFASQEECQRVAGIINQIGVKTDVRPEWESE
jgi:ATP-dependent Clp protease adaptor protein ClpS